ncbi:hypothetical protein ACWA1F_07055 [Flavobacterium sp. 3-218]
MKHNIGNYSIEKFENGNLKIDYRRSLNDYYYIFCYLLISVAIFYVCYQLSINLLNREFNLNTGLAFLFSGILFIAGLYFASVSFETFIKPTSNVFYIENTKEVLKIKLNLFRKIQVQFSEIKNFELGANDITIVSHNNGRIYKRQLYINRLYLKYTNNKVVKIHQFEKPNLLISFSEKKNNKSLKDTSKHITDLISKECNKNYFWTGTKKE